MTTNLSSPFRKWYGHIGELRSLLDSSVKFAVFTATASKSTKASLLTVLNIKPLLTHIIEKKPLERELDISCVLHQQRYETGGHI